MYIIVLSNDGAGRPEVQEVDEGMTAREFVEDVLDKEMPKYVVRVNGETVDGETVLRDGQRVTVAPVNVKGAGAVCVPLA
jgi:sulfur carrier protein ThiS